MSGCEAEEEEGGGVDEGAEGAGGFARGWCWGG